MSNPGAIGGGGLSTTTQVIGKNSKLTAVRVLDVILDLSHEQAENLGYYDSIGTIFFSKLDEDTSTGVNISRYARPLFTFIKNYPLRGEIVFIFTSPGRQRDRVTFYLPAANMWNHPHHNALPSIASLQNPETKQDYITADNGAPYRRVEDGSTGIDLGDTFLERLNIKPLVAYEGDSILEGRFGNSIRLGSTVANANTVNPWSSEATGSENGNPIIVIRNGQQPLDDEQSWVPTIENINNDPSSIYLTSIQSIDNLNVASPHQTSYGGKTLEPVPDILTNIPVTPDPPEEIEVEVIEEEPPVPITEEQEEEIQTVSPPPPPPIPTIEVEDPPTNEDELSPFDELLEEGVYDDEFEEQGDLSGTEFNSDDDAIDGLSEDELNGEINLEGYEIGDSEGQISNSSGDGNNEGNAGSGNNSNQHTGNYTNQTELNSWISKGWVKKGVTDEAQPTSFPMTITSIREYPKNSGKFQKYTMFDGVSPEEMSQKILNGKRNTNIRYLCVHTSATRGWSPEYTLYYFLRRKTGSKKVHNKYHKLFHTTIGGVSEDTFKALSNSEKTAKSIEIYNANKSNEKIKNGTFKLEDKKITYTYSKGWARPGYQTMIDTDGKCYAPVPTAGAASDQHPQGSSAKNVGDDCIMYWGQGGYYKGRGTKPPKSIRMKNNNTIAISWLPKSVGKGEGGVSSKGPIGITSAHCHAIKLLIDTYVQKYPDIQILGHNNKSEKECPGFNVQELCRLMHESGDWNIKERHYKGGAADYTARSSYKKGDYITGAEVVYNDGSTIAT